MHSRRLAAVLTIILALISNRPAVSQEQTGVYRIGVIQSLTGVAREDGQTVVRSLQLAQDEINHRSPKKIELLVEDDASTPRNATAAFQKLAAAKVDAIIGATWVHTSAAIAPLAASHQIVAFNTSNFPEALNFTEGKGYVFTNAYALAEDVPTFDRYVTSRHVKKVVFIRNVTNWSLLQLEAYKEIASKREIQVLDIIESSEIDNNDWRSFLPRIKASRPDAVVIFMGKDDVEVVLRRLKEIGYSLPVFGANHTYDGWKKSKDRAAYNNVCFTYPLESLQKHPSFAQRYEQRFREPPQLYADSSYDSLFILHFALTAARSENTSLKAVLERATFNGLFGVYKYDPQRSLSRGTTSLVCVKDGALEIR